MKLIGQVWDQVKRITLALNADLRRENNRCWRQRHLPRRAAEALESRNLMANDFVAGAQQLFNIENPDVLDSAFAKDAAVLSNEKILVLGEVTGQVDRLIVTRHHPSIRLDTSFGDQGIAAVDLGENFSAIDIKVLADNKILVLARVGDGPNSDLAFIRLTAQGTLDESFGTGGIVERSWGTNDLPAEMSIKSDGDILVAGTQMFGNNADFAVARYNSDGTPDTAFGTNGLTILKMKPAQNDSAVGLRQISGKILLVGTTQKPDDFRSRDVAMARLTSDGKLDKTFSSDGKHFAGLGGGDLVTDFLVDSSNRILVCAIVNTSTDERSVVARFKSSGAFDTTFGVGGIAKLDPANEPQDNPDQTTRFTQIGIRPDGRIVLTGERAYYFSHRESSEMIAARLRSDGRFDTGFGEDGIIAKKYSSGGSDYDFNFIFGMAVLPNGKLLGLGGAYNGDAGTLVVTRFD